MILDFAKQRIALLLAGSISTYPNFFMLGSGSGATLSTDTTLVCAVDRQAVTSTNGSNSQKVTWIGDWNSVEMSGIQLREFGMTGSNPGTTGSMWSKMSMPTITFDGTNELRIEENWEVF
jgi:hypothetical protein